MSLGTANALISNAISNTTTTINFAMPIVELINDKPEVTGWRKATASELKQLSREPHDKSKILLSCGNEVCTHEEYLVAIAKWGDEVYKIKASDGLGWVLQYRAKKVNLSSLRLINA